MALKLWIAGLAVSSIAWTQPANQTGIAHVAFRVSDLGGARTFFQKLGFEQFFEMKQGERTTEAFIKINDHQFIELYPQTDAAKQPLGLMHVCYESSDLDALHAEYVKRGLTVSEVRKAGAGNMLMTMKDPEGQTIEYTQYMPGSRHYEDRGKHLGEKRVSDKLLAATAPAKDVAAIRAFYVEKLGFMAAGSGPLRMPGDSGQKVDVVGSGASGIEFAVGDLKKTASALAAVGLDAKSSGSVVTVTGPDGVVVSFVRP